MLIAIEGVDASGKEMQSNLLLERLRSENRKARKVEFPNYAGEAAGAVRMYLNGEFGGSPNDVNPYAASTFFAVDRYASYKADWGAFLDAGGIVVADRYTMSNMIHQGAKFADEQSRLGYIEWLADLEFNKIGLPKPDIVIFLDLSMELRIKLMEKRMRENPGHGGKAAIVGGNNAAAHKHVLSTGTSRADSHSHDISAGANRTAADNRDISAGANHADIHERDHEYLKKAHGCAREIAALLGWTRVDVEKDGALRPAEDIHNEIFAAVERSSAYL